MLMLYLAIIDNAGDSDKDIFVRLYREYRLKMLHVAYGIMHDKFLAEDAVHNAFLKVAQNMNRYDFTRDAGALLVTITANCARTILRKESREYAGLNNSSVQRISNYSDIERDYENKSRIERISRAIAELPDEFPTIFILKFKYRMSSKEIASYVGLSDDVVRKRIQRLRKIIRDVDEGE